MSFDCFWSIELLEWREFFKPFSKRSNANPKQKGIQFAQNLTLIRPFSLYRFHLSPSLLKASSYDFTCSKYLSRPARKKKSNHNLFSGITSLYLYGGLSINPLRLYHKCYFLIGYAIHYLFCCRTCVAVQYFLPACQKILDNLVF